MFDAVQQDEMEFLRHLLKCDAAMSQETKQTKNKLAKKDYSDYVESIAKLRQMLGNLENSPKRSKTDTDMIEYRKRINYLDSVLDRLEVEQMPQIAEMSLIPPAVDEKYSKKDSNIAVSGQMSGGCVFKKAAEAAEKSQIPNTSGGCIFKKASQSSSAGVCPMSGKKSSDVDPSKIRSEDDLFNETKGMGGCPMVKASPEESAKIRQELADLQKQDEEKKKCPMSGQTSTGGGCPMAAPGEHPELDGTWMSSTSNDPESCPTFLKRPFIDAPKYSKVDKIQADLGLEFLENAQREVEKTIEEAFSELKNNSSSSNDVLQDLDTKMDKRQTSSISKEEKDYLKPSDSNLKHKHAKNDSGFFFAHVEKLWMMAAVAVFGYFIARISGVV